MTIIVLWILLALIALVVILLHFSVYAYVRLDDDGFFVRVKYLFFTIYPREKKEKEVKDEDKSKEELLDLVKHQAKMIADLQDDINYLKSKLDKERGMKESLELELLEMKKVNKMHLAEQVVELRKELGLREEALDELMMLSEESLNSSIKTFMEFKESTTFSVNKLPKIQSDALVNEEQDNTVKEVTESVNNNSNSNIDYEQEIDDWFKKMTHRKYFN